MVALLNRTEMALLVKKFATTCTLYRPAMATGGRFLDRCFGCHDVRRLTTNTFCEAFMNRIPRAKRELSRKLSLTFDPKLTPTWIRPTRTREGAECLMVDIYLSSEGSKNMRMWVYNRSVFIKARSDRKERTYVCWFDLPDINSTPKIYNTSDIKAVFRAQKGWLELTIPKLNCLCRTVPSESGILITRECERCFYSDDDRRRRLTTKTFYEAFMNRFLRAKRYLSRIYSLGNDPYLAPTRIQPRRTREDAECLMVEIHLPIGGPENMKISVDHNTVFVKGQSDYTERTYVCWFDLPDIDSTTKIYKASDIKAVLRVQQGSLELIIPKLKKEEIKYTVDVKTITEEDEIK